MARHRTALVVNSSPHEPSITTRFCDIFTDNFGPRYTRRLDLHKEPPPYSNGTYDNDNTKWQKHVIDADVLFIATPTYWFNIPSILKAFIEDLAAIDEILWEGDRYAVIAIHAPEGGEIGALNALMPALNMLGFTLPGNGFVYYRSAADDWAWNDLGEVAKRVRFDD
jgi:NAD(P)H-dependent FMN reductase